MRATQSQASDTSTKFGVRSASRRLGDGHGCPARRDASCTRRHSEPNLHTVSVRVQTGSFSRVAAGPVNHGRKHLDADHDQLLSPSTPSRKSVVCPTPHQPPSASRCVCGRAKYICRPCVMFRGARLPSSCQPHQIRRLQIAQEVYSRRRDFLPKTKNWKS